MSHNTNRPRRRNAAAALTAAALCLAAGPDRVYAQAGSIPAGAPQTAPTTLKGNPIPTPAIPAQGVTSPLTTPVDMASPPSGFLGLSLTPHFDAAQKPDGVFVGSVDTGGPGASADIRPADLITAYNDLPVTDPDALTALVAAQTPGATARLSVQRNGTARTVSVQLGQTPPATLGSGGLTTLGVDSGPPPFSGTYEGKYQAVFLPGAGVTGPQTGTITLTVTPGGTAIGSIHGDAGGSDGTVAGTVSGGGRASLAFTFTDGVSGTIEGTLAVPPGGYIRGVLSQSFGPSPSAALTWEGRRQRP